MEQTTETKQANKVFACTKCGKKILAKYNFRKSQKDWKCYVCGNEMETPAKRRADFYEDILGYKKVKEPVKDELGRVLKGEYNIKKVPIRRKNKRKFTDDDVIERDKIVRILREEYMKNPYKLSQFDIRNAAFIAYIFLTGSRVEEVVGVPAVDGTGKKLQGRFAIEPVRKSQITKLFYKKRDVYIWQVKDLPVLKRRVDDVIDHKDAFANKARRVVPRRTVAIPLHIEKEFVEYIDRWLATLGEDDYVFTFTSGHARRICYRFNMSYNHFWRHIRATDLTKTYGFQSLQLKHFFGWASEAMAQRYAHLGTENLIDAMLIGFENRGEKVE